MIQEIVNYTKHLKEESPKIFEDGLEPSKGLHIFVELNGNGKAINFPGVKGVDWDYYDGEEKSEFLKKIIPYEQFIQRIGITMNKAFDKKKQIVSCSPYAISFKKEKLENDKLEGDSFEKIINLLPYYFDKGLEECIDKNEDFEERISVFQDFLIKNLSVIESIEIFNEMKNDNFINLYFKNVSLNDYKKANKNYLKRNLFNKNDFNSDKEISDSTYGLSGFINGLNSKKPFLEHKTASMYKGISVRIQAKDTVYLNDFEVLLRRKAFPSPLPIFIDKNEFRKTGDIILLFKEDEKLTYSQILKKIFNKNANTQLENYYLLFFNNKYELEDFDFVSKFRYSLKENDKYPKIINIFELKENKELKPDYKIKNIFQFEAEIVRKIFNNILVLNNDKNYRVHYFNKIDSKSIDLFNKIMRKTPHPMYQLILKYRKAFYDYIYKSKTQAINSSMWDEIMWNSIIADLREDKLTDKGYHSKEYSIKEKLNIWFSLYNYFINGERREDMASKIPKLLEKMKEVANNDDNHFESTEEFAFGVGQLIFFLLNQSRASERTHALLEPFIQKVKVAQLQNAVAQTINAYKHEISFGKGRFERLSAEVLGYDTDENLKEYQRVLLAGYFATPVIYEKKEKKDN